MLEQKGWVKGSKLGETYQGLFIQIPLGGPLFSEIKEASFLRMKGGHLLHESLMACVRGDQGGQRILPAPAVSQTSSA